MVLRNIIREHIPHTIYKHTAPYNAHSAVMLTHYVDSRTGMDSMHFFSEYQQQNNVKAHYNITARYRNDIWMTDFYLGNQQRVNQLKLEGHTIASHSVGHFPDFADKNTFPLGQLGNDTSNYKPYYNGTETLNGSVLGELEVSRDLLENDINVNVRSFRARHLAYNDSLVRALELLDYDFNSTFSSNDVLSNFPYYVMKDRSFSSEESRILGLLNLMGEGLKNNLYR